MTIFKRGFSSFDLIDERREALRLGPLFGKVPKKGSNIK
jgi:hypothetical protein